MAGQRFNPFGQIPFGFFTAYFCNNFFYKFLNMIRFFIHVVRNGNYCLFPLNSSPEGSFFYGNNLNRMVLCFELTARCVKETFLQHLLLMGEDPFFLLDYKIDDFSVSGKPWVINLH